MSEFLRHTRDHHPVAGLMLIGLVACLIIVLCLPEVPHG